MLDTAENLRLGGQSGSASPLRDVRSPQREQRYASSRPQRVVTAAICFTLISTVVVGIALGAKEQRVDTGLNAVSAMTGLITCVEALLFWKYGLQMLGKKAND